MAQPHLARSRQRKYQLRMKHHGRCTLCGKPLAKGSRSLCLKHLIYARERPRRKPGFKHRYGNTLGYNPQFQRNGGKSAPRAVKTSPVRFTYKTDSLEVTQSSSCNGNRTKLGLTTSLQTFLTALTWICSTNNSPMVGWLTVTLWNRSTLCRVNGPLCDTSSLQLLPVSRTVPTVLRGAIRRLGKNEPR